MHHVQGHTHGKPTKAVHLDGLFIGQASFAPHEFVPDHHHTLPAIVMVANGSFRAETPMGEFCAEPLTTLFDLPQSSHASGVRAGGHGFLAIVVECDYSWLETNEVPVEVFRALSSSPDLGLSVVRLASALSGNASDESLEALVLETLIAKESPSGRRPKWFRAAERYILEEYQSPISLSAVADEIGVHRNHLARTFRLEHGCTVGEYIARLRTIHAARNLAKGERSSAEVAYESGFFDQAHLTRTFRRLTGTTPATLSRAISLHH